MTLTQIHTVTTSVAEYASTGRPKVHAAAAISALLICVASGCGATRAPKEEVHAAVTQAPRGEVHAAVTQAASHEAEPPLSDSSRCAEWAGATTSARKQYIRKAEPSIADSSAIVTAVSEYVETTCSGTVNLALTQAAMNGDLEHVTGLQPGERPPAISTSGEAVLGATEAVWNAGHTVDPEYPEGHAYDPTEGLADGATDRFSSVQSPSGRVGSFYVAFPPKTSLSDGLRYAKAVVPKDAAAGPLTLHPGCPDEAASVLFHSSTLLAESGSPYAVAYYNGAEEEGGDASHGVVGAEVELGPEQRVDGC